MLIRMVSRIIKASIQAWTDSLSSPVVIPPGYMSIVQVFVWVKFYVLFSASYSSGYMRHVFQVNEVMMPYPLAVSITLTVQKHRWWGNDNDQGPPELLVDLS